MSTSPLTMLRRRLRFAALFVLVGAIAAAGPGWTQNRVVDKRYNVLFILIDTLRADHLTSYGYGRNTTPNIDLVAAGGVRFTRAISAAPWTYPSVASIFTSLYPSVHNVVRQESEVMGTLSDEHTTMAEIFARDGYKTGAYSANPWISKRLNFDKGFEHFTTIGQSDGRILTGAALRWIRQYSRSPFFLYLHYMDAHCPYDKIPAPFSELFPEGADDLNAQKLTPQEQELVRTQQSGGCLDLPAAETRDFYVSKYDREIRLVDFEVGRLISELRDRDRLDDTLVIIAADHGIEFFEHGHFGFGEHLYTESLHVPLVMRLPGKLPANVEVANQVRTIDILPTMLSLLDFPEEVRTSNRMQGVDLLPLVRREADFELNAMSEAVDRDDATRNDDLKSLRSPRYTLIFDRETLAREFYDRRDDPFEQSNVGQDRALADPLRRLQQELVAASEENRRLYQAFHEESTYELDEETKEKLRSLGYVK